MNTLDFSTFEPNFINDISQLWWGIFGIAAVVAILVFIAVTYHWIKYEIDRQVIYTTIAVNFVVSTILLGGSAMGLITYLNS